MLGQQAVRWEYCTGSSNEPRGSNRTRKTSSRSGALGNTMRPLMPDVFVGNNSGSRNHGKHWCKARRLKYETFDKKS